MNTIPPTTEQAAAIQALYDLFRDRLFHGELPACVLNFSREKERVAGFFAAKRWRNDEGEIVHEISLNPRSTVFQSPTQIASTLAHEMVHLWQAEYGKPSRGGYHNQEWAGKMESIGLMPSDTGAPGGHKIGQKISDYVLPGGPFALLLEQLNTHSILPWQAVESLTRSGAHTPPPRPEHPYTQQEEDGPAPHEELTSLDDKKKHRYSCPICRVNVWGKPALNIVCGICHAQLQDTSTMKESAL